MTLPLPLAALAALAAAAPFAAPSVTPTGPDPLASLAPPTSEGLADQVALLRLENGWTFLLLPQPGAPVVSFETYIDVGSVNERPGITGMAHMFEHMAFKGSDRVGTKDWPQESLALDAVERTYQAYAAALEAGDEAAARKAEQAFTEAQAVADTFVEPEEFSRLLEDAGGSRSLNASTSAEETRYTVSLPSNQIELWAWLERERFTRGVLREFYKERGAVQEERRMRVESNPQGLVIETLITTAFGVHPYRFPTIGTAQDLQRYTRTEAEAFFAANYGARRYITAIVGDFDPKTLEPLLRRYFADVPAGPEPVAIAAVEPDPTAERRAEVHFPAQPMVAIGWRTPGISHADAAAVDVAVRLLAFARTSRLEKKLVREDGSAVAVMAATGFPGDRYPNLAVVLALPAPGVETAVLETTIESEIERLAAEGPEPEELAGVIATARSEVLQTMRSQSALAGGLAEYQAKTGSWKHFFEEPERLAAVTPADVQRVLTTYFTAERRTVVTLVSEQEEGQ